MTDVSLIDFAAYMLIIAVVIALSLLFEKTRFLACGSDTLVKGFLGHRQSISFVEVSSAAIRADAFGEPSIVIKRRDKRRSFIVPLDDCREPETLHAVIAWLALAAQNGAEVQPSILSRDFALSERSGGMFFPGHI